VLNNDTVVGHPDLLIYISIAMYTEEKIGVVGPLIYDYFDKQQRVDINESMFYKISDRLCLKTDKNIRTIKDNITIKPVVCVAGCAIAFSRELLEKVGLFDETFFMYCEEIDLCFRAIMSGYKVVKIEDEKAKIFHKKSKLYYTPPYVWYYITRNMIKVINKNFSNLKWFLLFCFNIAAVLYRTLKLLLNDDLEGAMACLLGLYDGLLGRSGPKLS
jgi:GT2 family glycosyltransferase